MPDTLATSYGAYIGWRTLDGTVPGCFAAATLVEAVFRVVGVGSSG